MTEKRTEDLDKLLTGEIYNSDESWKVLTDLCLFGGRFFGTKSERQAVNYMLKKFEEYGLDNSHLEEFEYLNWKRGSSKLEVIEPSEMARELPCIGQIYSPNGVVEASLIDCEWGHPDTFEKLSDKIKDNIVLVRTRASHEAISGKALQETDTQKYARAVKAGAVGYINMNNAVGQPAMTRAMHGNMVAEIPASGVSYANGKVLLDLMKRWPVTVRMTEKNHEIKKMKSWNVVGEIKGTSKSDEIVFWGAHHDGRDVNQGCHNDASGATVAIEAARALAKHKGSFKRTLKIAIFSCEMCGLIGSYAYVQAHKDEMQRIRWMLNLDVAGRPGGGGLGIMTENSPEMIPFLKSAAEEMKLSYQMLIQDRFTYGSDHLPFMLQGVPAANPTPFGSEPEREAGWPYEMGIRRGWREAAEDTIDKTRPEFVRYDAIAVARILMRVANADDIPAKHKTWDETIKILNEYGFAEQMYAGHYRTPDELAKYGVFD
jgi:Zn-dependent M28 family amino/carboxypeptidase